MRFPTLILLVLSASLMHPTAGEAQQSAQPQTGPASVPAPAPQTGSPSAPAPAHHSRSPKKAAPHAVAPAPASKPDSGTPDVVVGGLPGVQSAAPGEKQP